MKAIVTTRYGPPEVLQLREIAMPAPQADEILIKLFASSVNPLDGYMMRGPLFFLPPIGKRLKPKHPVLGADIAGRVEAVGKNVTRFHPGDEVFGASLTKGSLGGFAEYACTVEDGLALKPSRLSFEQAAAVPVAAITALQGLRDQGQIKPGQHVLIDGASGGVGTFAIQIAKSFGAEVTAVCSPPNVATASLIGADHVIDYTHDDFTRGGQHYDLIFGANAHHSIFAYMRSLNSNGIFVVAGGGFPQVIQGLSLGPLLSRLGSRKIRFFIAKINAKDMTILKELLEAGKITPVIDRCYPLSQAAEALRYREEGHARGKVVITIATPTPLRGTC